MDDDFDPMTKLSKELGTLAIKGGLPPSQTMLAMLHAMVGLLTVGTDVSEAKAIEQVKKLINKYEKGMAKFLENRANRN